MKAVLLFNSELYNESISYFEKSVDNNYSLKKSVAAKYWISRALYEIGKFEKSLKISLELKMNPNFLSLLDKEIFLDYDIAYNYLKLSKYDLAISAFNESLKSSFSDLYRYDAYIRIADSYFIQKSYDLAIENYKRELS